MNIAIQGAEGSFHHQAAENFFNAPITLSASTTFRGVFAMVEQSQANYGLVAVENTLYGSITETLDLLESYSKTLTVIGETYLHVRQQLIGLPGVQLSDITSVYSHPVALAQCEAFFKNNLPQAQVIEYHDTAAAVEFIKQQNDPTKAAVAGIVAAKHHNLPIIASNIEDNSANYTRFLAIARHPQHTNAPNKASLILTTNHKPGALSTVLAGFATAGTNLTKLESRPIVGNPWRYKFYVDIEGAPEAIERSLTTVHSATATITVLGRYSSGAN